MKITIGIPVYITNDLHFDFTEKTVESIKTSYDYDLKIIVNHCATNKYWARLETLGGDVIENLKGNNVSAAWNLAIKEGIASGSDYIFIPNNDLVFHPKCIDNLVDFAQQHKEFDVWTSAEHSDLRTINTAKCGTSFDEHPHFSCFMLSPDTIFQLEQKEKGTKEPLPGYFDENFIPAYFEDGDFHNRLLRAGMKASKTASSLFYHFGSRTIKVDEKLNNRNKHTYEACRQYFIKKWGWDPHGKVATNDDPLRFRKGYPFKN